MSAKVPFCCSTQGFDLLASQLPHLESPDALLMGAVAIAMHQAPDIDPAAVDAKLQRYADTVRSRVRGRQPQALLAHFHEFLFEHEHFAGDTEEYYNPLNSYLPSVITRKKGLPITLSLLYRLVAGRIGLRAWGVGLPGHFTAAVQIEGAPMLIDAFAGGRVITSDEALQRMRETYGPEVEWSPDLLQPVSNRHWLTRMLQNLLNVFSEAGQFDRVAAVLEMEMLLWPQQTHLQRDLGLVLARCGMSRPASLYLDRYLKANPDDPQTPQIRELLQVLIA